MFKLRGSTVGLRFTVLYSAAFLASGVGLLTLAAAFSGVELSSVAPTSGQWAPNDAVAELEAQLIEANDDHARQLLLGSLAALGVMAAVSLLVGRMISRRVLRPLRTITAATRGISADDLDKRLAVTGPDDEVKDLADTIDGLLGRLQASFESQRSFVANASHELRTPLATMGALLDVAAAKPNAPAPTVALAERMRPQLNEVDRLLDGLLMLARAQHGALAVEAVDLTHVTDRAMTKRAPMVEAKRLTVTTNQAGKVHTSGDAALLTRMAENLIDNAVVHNQHGGWIRITTTRDEKTARLIVENGGTVLGQSEVDELSHPFRRLGGDRTGTETGTGLGLSIVASIAEAHSGRLVLSARSEGGLRAEVTMPSSEISAEGAI